MARDPIPTWCFVLVAVRLGHRWLLVHEAKAEQLWFLPAGRVEPGESIVAAAKRETLEEAGIAVEPHGLVRVEHAPRPDGTARLRVILLAHPVDDTPPKRVADAESLRAAWFTLEEMRSLPLRGGEVLRLFTYLSGDPVIAPLSLLASEGEPFRSGGA
ncbi:MAG: NUDIX domain-containing protein [Phycisphaerales bacterium]